MNNNTPNGLKGAPTKAASLFSALVSGNDGYAEAFDSAGRPRAHWQALFHSLDAMGAAHLRQRQERARRLRYEDGATFNPFDDSHSQGTPWALDLMPLPIAQDIWAAIEAGLVQRAGLLEMILTDVYGSQQMVQQGRLPAEIMFANPRFLRPCHGIEPAGGRHLALYAADIYRDTDGRFRVWRDYCADPAGLGYALENRIVISRVFPALYPQAQVRRVAQFFQAFHNGLIERTALHQEDPGIVLLSPGPESHLYFEHALLSRYLGYPLVEGEDLTVRNGQVYLKKLAGLETVETVVRFVADDNIDPFALRGTAAGGVAGLIQACREQTVDVINPIGAGFIETPMLPSLLPRLCREIHGTDLLLENHPVWWGGDQDGLQYIRSHLRDLSLVPALDRTFPDPSRGVMQASLDQSAHGVLALAPVHPARVPVWNGGLVDQRPYLMRFFVCATEEGFSVMPGGLAITSVDPETLLNGRPDQSQSKDIWVLSDKPVAPFSLMKSLQTTTEVRRGSDLPSRVADHLLWLGRYLERAEGLVRILRSVFRRMSGEASIDELPEFEYLLELLRGRHILPPQPENASAIPSNDDLLRLLEEAVSARSNQESVATVLKQVQTAARNVRDRLSVDSWHVINRLEDFLDDQEEDPLDLLDEILFTLSAFSGLAMESMTRGLGWRFMDMGRRVERAITLSGLIRISLPRMCDTAQPTMEALLEVADSIMTYRARYRTTFQPAPVLDLLLLDESNPKSVAFQCSRLAGHVDNLPRNDERRFATSEERLALEMLTSLRLLDPTSMVCEGHLQEEDLGGFLTHLERQLKGFAQQVSAHYLTRIPATPHYAAIIQGDRHVDGQGDGP